MNAPSDNSTNNKQHGQEDDGEENSGGVIEANLAKHQVTTINNDQPGPLRCFFGALARKKPLDCRTDTNLNRCLNLLDLTALGVGSTLGLGLYVLAGNVASKKAGPAVVVSFALAALASAFSALCYAEFAGRVPKAGSAYAYSYITVGEFVAFVIGWNLVLEYVIGAASVARGFSGYLRQVFGHLFLGLSLDEAGPSMAGNLTLAGNSSSLTEDGLADQLVDYVYRYFDWPSVAIVVCITVFVLFGVKESTNVTMAFTAVNLAVVLTALVCSVGSLDLHNWRLAAHEVPAGFGQGGFLPYGWTGVLAGSSTCFFGFIGFDAIASSAEEARNPRRNVPLSILLSLFISFVAYMAVASVQTLMWPYYDQDRITILPYIFGQHHMPLVYWCVLLGALAGLASSQLGGMYPLPRILYSMAQDRLIYGQLAAVNRRLKLPVRATLVGSLLIALLACLLDIEDLADMVSIGTLAAYSLVSLSVLILRYEDRSSDYYDDSTLVSNRLSFSDILNSMELASVKSDPASNCHQQGAPAARQTLACKSSLPMREKGSRALEPQLSVGFNSWFQPKGQQQAAAVPSGPSYLDLLMGRWAWPAEPDQESSGKSKVLISALVLLCIALDLALLALTLLAGGGPPQSGIDWSQLLLASSVGLLTLLLAAVVLMLSRLPASRPPHRDMFQVPLVPLVPTLSLLVNTFLMLNLGYLTWVRFTVWMAVGLFIYFSYGLWHSQGYLLQPVGEHR